MPNKTVCCLIKTLLCGEDNCQSLGKGGETLREQLFFIKIALHPALAFTDDRVTVAGDPVAIALGKLLLELAAEYTVNKP